MAAGKDDGQKPPEGGRQAVIWRLPATTGSPERADAPEAPDTPEAQADCPKSRRGPLLAAIGLAVALVCVGLYAAWSEFGSDILGTGGDSDIAPSSPAAPGAQTAGEGATGGGTAASPPAVEESVPLAVADDEGADETVEASLVEEAAQDVAAEETEPAVTAAPEPAVPAEEPLSPSPALADDDPPATPAVASAHAEEQAVPDGAAAAAEATAVAAPDTQPVTASPAQADLSADALGVLNDRLQALEAEAAGAIGAGTAVIALEQRVRALEDDPAREPLSEALAAWGEQRAALEAALADVNARLARFEAEAAQQSVADGRLVTLVLATGELTAALGSSRPFAPTLNTLRGVAGEDPEIERKRYRAARTLRRHRRADAGRAERAIPRGRERHGPGHVGGG